MRQGETTSTIIGMALSMTVGSVFLQALGAIALGLLGALGGWMFGHFIKPRLDKYVKKPKP
jgi:hypothetical protein